MRHGDTRYDTNVWSTIITTPEHLVPTLWKNFSSGFPIENAMMCEWKYSVVFVRDLYFLFWRHQLYSVRLSHPCLFKLPSLVNNLVPGGFTSSLCDQCDECDERVVEMLRRYYYGSNNKRSHFERSRSIEVFLGLKHLCSWIFIKARIFTLYSYWLMLTFEQLHAVGFIGNWWCKLWILHDIGHQETEN